MPSNPLYALRINAVELLRQPGAERRVEQLLRPADLDIVDDRVVGDIGVSLVAVSSIDGIAVGGEVAIPWRSVCRRCLADVAGTVRAHVEEVYRYDASGDDDACPIVGDQIDLAPAVREYVLLDLPDDPLCRDDCRGICPVCGIDRNLGTCGCDTSVRDERWAALDDLRLDD